MKTKKRILIMAGGTGGHVFPALAVAKACQEAGIEVLWLGTEQGMEATLVPKANIPIATIRIAGLRRRGLLPKLLAPFQIARALLQSLKILIQFKPDVVLGMGGYVAGPGGIAAWILRIPLVIHEQNAISGVTNQILAKFSKVVLEGFPKSFPKNAKAIWVGNPVRQELINLPIPEKRFEGRGSAGGSVGGRVEKMKLLVLGGSQGALAINQLLPEVLSNIPPECKPEVWHQSGSQHFEATHLAYKNANQQAKIQAFIDNMAEAYAWADLVLCRAGALTVSELAAVGLGSILIPFPFAVDDHQMHNGRFLERSGAAQLFPQKALNPKILADIIIGLSQDRTRLLKMAISAKSLAKPRAVLDVVSHCKECTRAKHKTS